MEAREKNRVRRKTFFPVQKKDIEVPYHERTGFTEMIKRTSVENGGLRLLIIEKKTVVTIHDLWMAMQNAPIKC